MIKRKKNAKKAEGISHPSLLLTSKHRVFLGTIGCISHIERTFEILSLPTNSSNIVCCNFTAMNPNFDNVGKTFSTFYYQSFDTNRTMLKSLYVSKYLSAKFAKSVSANIQRLIFIPWKLMLFFLFFHSVIIPCWHLKENSFRAQKLLLKS